MFQYSPDLLPFLRSVNEWQMGDAKKSCPIRSVDEKYVLPCRLNVDPTATQICPLGKGSGENRVALPHGVDRHLRTFKHLLNENTSVVKDTWAMAIRGRCFTDNYKIREKGARFRIIAERMPTGPCRIRREEEGSVVEP